MYVHIYVCTYICMHTTTAEEKPWPFASRSLVEEVDEMCRPGTSTYIIFAVARICLTLALTLPSCAGRKSKVASLGRIIVSPHSFLVFPFPVRIRIRILPHPRITPPSGPCTSCALSWLSAVSFGTVTEPLTTAILPRPQLPQTLLQSFFLNFHCLHQILDILPR